MGIVTEGYKNKQVTMPIVAMMGGKDVQTYVDLLVPSYPATLKLVKGDGPVHLVGCHCVDYYGAQMGDDETEDEDMEAEEQEEESGERKGCCQIWQWRRRREKGINSIFCPREKF